MAYLSYSEKLQDIRWQKKRLKVLDRDSWTCTASDCRSKHKTLHVHHVQYFQGVDPWDYPMDMLITLCFDCHEKEKDRSRLERHLASTFKMNGFLLSDLLALSCKLELDKNFRDGLLKILRRFQDG